MLTAWDVRKVPLARRWLGKAERPVFFKMENGERTYRACTQDNLSAKSRWLDRETGKRFVVVTAGEGEVLLVSEDSQEVCSVNRENLAIRFAPSLATGLPLRKH